ncbi:MAG TPA: anthranilate phosphoribosyltransferase [Verrucomicrobiota bacterium]|nr:anthranilate phosphoribosyltransferase [Verrucomicrobiota bacterium]
MLRKYLDQVVQRRNLNLQQMEEVFEILTQSDVSCTQAGAILTAMRMKGESVDELVGAAGMLRRHATFIDCGGRSAVDIVGTGGDGGISFNISTTASFVAAGAGVTIAKHGNRAVSGKCGAADVLAELGFNLNTSAAAMENCIRNYGIGFLFAPRMHPIMGNVAALRKELGIRTLFNMIGPLCNPAGAEGIVLGVYDTGLTELFAEALLKLGVKRAMVVHGEDGLDEISCSAETRVTELKDGMTQSYALFPEMLLGRSYDAEEISGGDAPHNARILRSILEGKEQGAPRAIVVLNAAAAIYVAGLTQTLKEGLELAQESIDRGKALEKLEVLLQESHYE